METINYTAGEKAYLDTASGMVPCVVTRVIEPGNGRNPCTGKIQVKLTATRRAYHKGEVLELYAYYVIPRKHVHYVSRQQRVRTNYEWR